MKRTLTLRRETLTELTTDDLRDVVGGVSGVTCPVQNCLSLTSCDSCSFGCPTYNC